MTRVAVVDDHPLFRDGLAGLLVTAPDLEVVMTTGSAGELLAVLTEVRPDVVFMDINLPGMSGIEATARVVSACPSVAVLIVTMVDDDDTVLAALAAGARGYVLKGASAQEVLAALHTVRAGGAVFGAGVAARLLARASAVPPSGGRGVVAEDLTPREREVLDLLASGRTNSQIAAVLGLSLKTVQNHVSRILDKLQASDRTQAVLRARGLA